MIPLVSPLALKTSPTQSRRAAPRAAAPNPQFSSRSCSFASRCLAPAPRRVHTAHSRATVCAAAAEDYYAVLGVDKSADLKTIKSAYRKLALKFHPDVNKAPDATEKFTRIKEAFNVLSDEDQRRRYDRRGFGGGFAGGSKAGGGWDADFDFMNYKRPRTKQDEEFYGFGDFFRDLDKELSGVKSKSGKGDGRVKSLFEELADVGMSISGEFVEFLEMGLNGLEDPVKQKAAENQGYQDAVRGGGSAGAAGSGAGAKGSSGAGAGGGAGARRPPPPPPKPAEESVDDLLKKMKKEMGLE